jgi:hypothetical protein
LKRFFSRGEKEIKILKEKEEKEKINLQSKIMDQV